MTVTPGEGGKLPGTTPSRWTVIGGVAHVNATCFTITNGAVPVMRVTGASACQTA
jgi:hypothetical protein